MVQQLKAGFFFLSFFFLRLLSRMLSNKVAEPTLVIPIVGRLTKAGGSQLQGQPEQ